MAREVCDGCATAQAWLTAARMRLPGTPTEVLRGTDCVARLSVFERHAVLRRRHCWRRRRPDWSHPKEFHTRGIGARVRYEVEEIDPGEGRLRVRRIEDGVLQSEAFETRAWAP